MLIGLPASGKSTIAKELIGEDDNIVIHSSDNLRVELFNDINNQNDNHKLFNELNKRIIGDLREGKHVVMDATNVSRKRRRGLLQQLPKDVEKVAIYVSTEYKDIVEQNNNRKRVVPQHVIDRMYKTMQIPIYSEGWDKIVIYHNDKTTQYDSMVTNAIRAEALFNRDGYKFMSFLASYFDEFFGVYELAQDSTYHTFSVSRHIYYVYRYVLENYKATDTNEFEVMLWTALLHDVGKAFCKSFINRKGEETRYANFIGHDYVSSQMAVHFLHKMNFEDDFIHKVATLIQFHMYLLDEKANRDKLKRYVGEEMFKKLEFLRDADIQAH